MKPLAVFAWLGGAAFAAALAFTGYRFMVSWAEARPFDAARAAPRLAHDALLISLFALHHSVFARDRVKTALTRVLPPEAVRSVYVWTSSLLLGLALAWWAPIGGAVFLLSGWTAAAARAAQVAGVILIAAAARTIDPLELAGIRPHRAGDRLRTSGPYRLVRHPLYLGWMLAVFGVVHMTGDRLAFAVLTSLYLLLAVPWEERSLANAFGADYRRYQRRVRWRMIPFVY